MKKILFILFLQFFVFACTDDNADTPKFSIQYLQMPSVETPLYENQEVVIIGKGFNSESQIWLRNETKSSAVDVRAEVTGYTDNSITFKVPGDITGTKMIVLVQGNDEIELGVLLFKKKLSYYVRCYSKKINDLAEIDLENGKLIWQGFKIPYREMYIEGSVFTGTEVISFVQFSTNPRTYQIDRLDMATKEARFVDIKNLRGDASSFNDIMAFNGKYYTTCRDESVNEMAEIDIETGNLNWDGYNIPKLDFSGFRGWVSNGTELVTLSISYDASRAVIVNRLNMATKVVKTTKITNLQGHTNLQGLGIFNNKYYTLSYDAENTELIEIDLKTGGLVSSGLKCPDLGNPRGFVFNDTELVSLSGFSRGDSYILNINRLNMATKKVKNIQIDIQDIPNLGKIIAF